MQEPVAHEPHLVRPEATEDLVRLLMSQADAHARTVTQLESMQRRLTWRLTSPLRSMTVARVLSRLDPRHPADIAETSAERRAARRSAAYQAVWSRLREEQSGPRVGVMIHLHYPELWAPIWEALSALTNRMSIVVTATDHAYDELEEPLRDIAGLELVRVANEGRDMASFFAALERDWTDCAAILRLHGKRSPHLADGDEWRSALVQGLVEAAPAVLAEFDSDRSIAVVGDLNSRRRNQELEDSRTSFTTAWSLPEGFDWRDYRAAPFPVGGMFWFRPDMIDRFRALAVSGEAFRLDDPTAVDGQTSHLLERMIGWWPVHLGLGVADMRTVVDEAVILRALRMPEADGRSLLAGLLGLPE